MSQCKIALIALIAIAAWLFVVLPMIYLPDGVGLPQELLGMKPGEWLLSFATFVFGTLVRTENSNPDVMMVKPAEDWV
jgi:hypothetical protein